MIGDGTLRINDLHKQWPDGVKALDGVSFEVPRGQFVAILGPSGSGKSTLLHCINRLVEPTSGSVILGGRELTGLSSRRMMKARRHIGFIFQHFNLIPTYTVRRNVLAARIGHNPWWRNLLSLYEDQDLAIAENFVRRLGLLEKIDMRADELSGGQQQRVAIARAAAQEPDILLADEPMASLDPRLSKVILDLLKEISLERRITVMVNLHVLDLARQYGQRIIGLNAGKVVFDGPPEELTGEAVARIYAQAADADEVPPEEEW